MILVRCGWYCSICGFVVWVDILIRLFNVACVDYMKLMYIKMSLLRNAERRKYDGDNGETVLNEDDRGRRDKKCGAE